MASAPKNYPPTMQLRDSRKRKPPRRLEDELAEGEGVESARMQKHRAYHGPIIAYNPNLPPARFPTLDPRKNYPCDSHAHVNPVQHIQHKSPAGPADSSPHQQPPLMSLPNTIPTEHTRDGTFDGLDPSLTRELHLTNVNHLAMIPFQGRPQDDTSNGPDNPIWTSNMQTFKEWGDMTEEELIMAEMSTSEEEDPAKVKNHLPCPSWDVIPVRLRIDMIAIASGNDKAIEPALRRLRLDPTQQHAAIEDYRQHLERENEDDRNIAKHQQLMHRTLLHGPRNYTTPAGLQTLASVHLYQNLDRADVGVRPPDVAAARAYMKFCGLRTDFLDSWARPAQATPELCMDDEDAHDAQWPLSVSLREAVAKSEEDARQVSTPSHPSTPVVHQLSYGSSPQAFFTPKAQHHTPSLREQPQISHHQTLVKSPLNGQTNRQTTIDARIQPALLAANRKQGRKLMDTPAPSPQTTPTPSRNLISPLADKERDTQRPSKRQRPNGAVNGHTRLAPSPITAINGSNSANGAVNGHANLAPSTATAINGAQHRVNGHGAASATTNAGVTGDASAQTARNGAVAGEKRNGLLDTGGAHAVKVNGTTATKKKAGKKKRDQE
ncbi:MAG: hypothetical protein Q9182_000871 [Xanthomendoza sp. 2 TL-2023]